MSGGGEEEKGSGGNLLDSHGANHNVLLRYKSTQNQLFINSINWDIRIFSIIAE